MISESRGQAPALDDTNIVPRTADRNALWRALSECPSTSMYWASLGYALGVEHGEQAVLRRLGQAGDDVAAGGLPHLRQPRFLELEQRRRIDHSPCPRKCRKCSRCIAYESWYRRGRRPFLGVAQERELAAGGGR